jgi:hypothetical protein
MWLQGKMCINIEVSFHQIFTTGEREKVKISSSLHAPSFNEAREEEVKIIIF